MFVQVSHMFVSVDEQLFVQIFPSWHQFPPLSSLQMRVGSGRDFFNSIIYRKMIGVRFIQLGGDRGGDGGVESKHCVRDGQGVSRRWLGIRAEGNVEWLLLRVTGADARRLCLQAPGPSNVFNLDKNVLEEACGGILDDLVGHFLVVCHALVGVEAINIVSLGAPTEGFVDQLGN